MSMRVMIIPEDPTYDRYIVQPIVEALLAQSGRTCSVKCVVRSSWRG